MQASSVQLVLEPSHGTQDSPVRLVLVGTHLRWVVLQPHCPRNQVFVVSTFSYVDKKNSVVAGPQRTRALVCVLAGLCAFTAVVWYAA